MSRTSPNKVLYKPPFDDQQHEVLQMINDGWSDSKIAQHYDVTKDTIWCRRARWGFPSGSETRDRKLVDDITELWKNCYTVDEIAKVLNISECVVYVKMREYKIRDIPRLGLDVTTVSLSELGRSIPEDPNEDETLLVTFNRQPRFVMMPVDDYIAKIGT